MTAPREGEAYYGWLSAGGASPVSLGEIPVVGEDVLFDAELGFDGLLGGYDTFFAVAAPAGSPTQEGEALWAGQVDPKMYAVIQELAIASTSTEDGDGMLRAMETDLEALIDAAQRGVDATMSVDEHHELAEGLYNGITGANADLDDDGVKTEFDSQDPLLGAKGWVERVLSGLDVLSASVEPGDPVKYFANYAYDCTQRVESHAEFAAASAGVGAVCASSEACDAKLEEIKYELEIARDGTDLDGDKQVDRIDEGTVECALYYVGQMARMRVEVP